MKTTFTVALILAIQSVDAQEWPRFRGPNGSGVSEASIPQGVVFR